MPSKFFTLVALMAIATMGVAQPYWADDFETYVAAGTITACNPAGESGYLCYQDPATTPGAPTSCSHIGNSGGWDGWFNNPIEAGIVRAGGAQSGTNYLDVSPALGCQDAVHPFKENATTVAGLASGAPYTTYPQTGAWVLSAWFQVPVGGLALGDVYFIVNNDYNNAGTATSWSIQNQMTPDPANPGQYIMYDNNNGNTSVTGLMEGVWYQMWCSICLDANAIRMEVRDSGGAMVGGAPLSTRVYENNAGPTEIANLDLFSAGGMLYYDNIVCDTGPCGPFEYQFDQAGVSSLVLDGNTFLDVFNGIENVFGYGFGLGTTAPSNHSLAVDAAGSLADILITPQSPVYARSNAVVSGINSAVFANNTLNVDLFAPGAFFLYGGPWLNPQPTPAFNLVFNAGVIPAGTSSAQMGTISATNPDGFALSRAVGMDVAGTIGYLETTAVLDLESFEASTGWATPATYGANWQTAAAATGAWTVNTGGTPSGGTGPGGAAHGTQYVYAEMSGGANVNDFILEMINPVSSPGATTAYYQLHLNGANTGTFFLEEYDSGTGTWVPIDTVLGPLGAAWTNRSASLMFGGTLLRLRTNGATGWSADCAVDSFSLGS